MQSVNSKLDHIFNTKFSVILWTVLSLFFPFVNFFPLFFVLKQLETRRQFRLMEEKVKIYQIIPLCTFIRRFFESFQNTKEMESWRRWYTYFPNVVACFVVPFWIIIMLIKMYCIIIYFSSRILFAFWGFGWIKSHIVNFQFEFHIFFIKKPTFHRKF